MEPRIEKPAERVIGRHLAIDLGEARTGLAMCDDLGLLASPYDTLHERDREKLAAGIAELCAREGVAKVVIGLPLHMDGNESAGVRAARDFAAMLDKRGSPPVDFQDERLTSWEAEGRMIRMGIAPSKRKKRLDAAAAQMILAAYLERVYGCRQTDADAALPAKPPRRRGKGRS